MRRAPGGATKNQSVCLLGIGFLAIIAPCTTSFSHLTRTITNRVTFTSNLRQLPQQLHQLAAQQTFGILKMNTRRNSALRFLLKLKRESFMPRGLQLTGLTVILSSGSSAMV